MSCIMEKRNTVHSMPEWKSLFEMLTKFMWGLVQGDIAAWSSWLWENFIMQSTRTKVVHPVLSQVYCLFHCVSWNFFLHFLVLRRCSLWLFPHKDYFLDCYHTCQVCAHPAGGSRCTLSLQQVVLGKWQAGALLTNFLFWNMRGMEDDLVINLWIMYCWRQNRLMLCVQVTKLFQKIYELAEEGDTLVFVLIGIVLHL